ncbi:hypothetical protein Tco_1427529 [Tanacetum coccineum]
MVCMTDILSHSHALNIVLSLPDDRDLHCSDYGWRNVLFCHLTNPNKDFLTDYQELDGGFVAFGRSARYGGGDSVERAITTAASLDAAHDSDKTRSERVLEKPNEPPLSEGHSSGSREGRMKHQFELIANVPITPYDSPLPGGYTPGSDEGRLKLRGMHGLCVDIVKTTVLILEKGRDAQAGVDPQTNDRN